MRKSRYQKGSVKKQRGRWVAMWWVDHSRKSRVIGLVKDMTKSDARAVVDGIVTEANAKHSKTTGSGRLASSWPRSTSPTTAASGRLRRG